MKFVNAFEKQEQEEGNRVDFQIMSLPEYMKYCSDNDLSFTAISPPNVTRVVDDGIECKNKAFHNLFHNVSETLTDNFHKKRSKTDAERISTAVCLSTSGFGGVYLVAKGVPACGTAATIEDRRLCSILLKGINTVMQKGDADVQENCKVLIADYNRNGYRQFGDFCEFADGSTKKYKPTKEESKVFSSLFNGVFKGTNKPKRMPNVVENGFSEDLEEKSSSLDFE